MSTKPSLQTPSGALGHAADRLCECVRRVGSPVCVGLDPVLERLPGDLASSSTSPTSAIETFCLGVLDAIAGQVGVVKFQSACFERYGSEGVAVLERSLAAARERDLMSILDAKRGDIGISAAHYAAAATACGSDWVTINGWLGEDGIAPFLDGGIGAFVLVRTSNPSGETIQNQSLVDGRTVAESMGDLVTSMGADHVGEHGYSTLGAVIGATHPAELEGFRSRLPGTIFLLPGYGAQGGTAEDLASCFDDNGLGALVTASRSVIYAGEGGSGGWTDAVRQAATELADDVGTVAGMRS
ncbi:MAG: orotidine-5'-phosphate decarboxylase [Phycisphaerales bacterium]|nr:orotidine-5'-phosphate decarboxylase [Phycisphaerales bacterium]